MKFGTTKETTSLDDLNSTISIIRKVRNFEVIKTIKQYREIVKVSDSKDEMKEYIKHTENIREKRLAGVLVLKDDDESLEPGFKVKYPKTNTDGTYFVIKTWSEHIN